MRTPGPTSASLIQDVPTVTTLANAVTKGSSSIPIQLYSSNPYKDTPFRLLSRNDGGGASSIDSTEKDKVTKSDNEDDVPPYTGPSSVETSSSLSIVELDGLADNFKEEVRIESPPSDPESDTLLKKTQVHEVIVIDQPDLDEEAQSKINNYDHIIIPIISDGSINKVEEHEFDGTRLCTVTCHTCASLTVSEACATENSHSHRLSANSLDDTCFTPEFLPEQTDNEKHFSQMFLNNTSQTEGEAKQTLYHALNMLQKKISLANASKRISFVEGVSVPDIASSSRNGIVTNPTPSVKSSLERVACDSSFNSANNDTGNASSALNKSQKRIPKFNSCSTLFVDPATAISNLQQILKCLAMAVSMQIKITEEETPQSQPDDEILLESLYPLSRNLRFDSSRPTDDEVYKFLDCLFTAAELGMECAVITMVYMDRFLQNSHISLNRCNWSRAVLGAIMLASKVWDDHAVWNVDFCNIFPDVQVADMNKLERYYMNKIEYNVSVRAGVYAKYYFELRDVGDKRNLNLEPLNMEMAQLTEHRTQTLQDKMLYPDGVLRRKKPLLESELRRANSDYIMKNGMTPEVIKY